MKKRIIALFIAAVIAISCAGTAFADNLQENGNQAVQLLSDDVTVISNENPDGAQVALKIADLEGEPVGIVHKGWQKIDGKYYYFDPETEEMQYGWIQNGAYKYYCGDDGVMFTGIQEIDGSWYFFRGGDSGRMMTGWQKANGKYYYFAPETGKMQYGWIQNGAYKYYCGDNGVMLTGWQKIEDSWYLFRGGDSGRMLTGWQTVNGQRFYMDPVGGKVLMGWQKIDGSWYLFKGGNSGRMLTGWQKVGSYWYYMNPSTGIVMTGWQKINGSWYLLKSGDSGRMLTGWQTVNGQKYYMDPSTGKVLTGWQEIDGMWWYFKEGDSGRLLKGPVDRNGTVTALGITVPADTRSTNLKMEEVANFKGQISQDGSWKWIDASKTTPKRGDIVVYYNPHEQYYSASHVCVCVTDYNGKVYKAVDGNYGGGDGYVRSGYGAGETPNKGWRDSFQDERDGYQNQETAMGVWRCEKYAEQMASAAEDVLAEFKSMGQYKWLQTYIPNAYYGGWCYYLIPIVVVRAAQ